MTNKRRCNDCTQNKPLKEFKEGKGKTRTLCQACRASRGSRSRNGVSPHCDQYCPICGAGPFVVATAHVTRVHGLTNRECRQRYGVLSNQSFRDGTQERFAGGWPSTLGPAALRAQLLSPARHKRWIQVATEEQLKGGQWIVRCAKRWRIPYKTARSRIRVLQSLDLLGSVKVPAHTCRKGHPLTPQNVWQDRPGRRLCAVCRTARYQRFSAKERQAA